MYWRFIISSTVSAIKKYVACNSRRPKLIGCVLFSENFSFFFSYLKNLFQVCFFLSVYQSGFRYFDSLRRAKCKIALSLPILKRILIYPKFYNFFFFIRICSKNHLQFFMYDWITIPIITRGWKLVEKVVIEFLLRKTY